MVTDNQSLQELDFQKVISQLASYAICKSAQNKIFTLQPSGKYNEVLEALETVQEKLYIKNKGLVFPALEFEELINELKILPIENSVLSAEGVQRILLASNMVNAILQFLEKNPSFIHVSRLFKSCYYSLELIQPIQKIFDKTGKIKDDASPYLLKIRISIKTIRNQINRNFDREMRRFLKSGYLGETSESFIQERRVLSVQSSYKRSVSGAILGSSKTGNLTYIEPQANVPLNHEIEALQDDEQKEIRRILWTLTQELRVFFPLIKAYQQSLVSLDIVNAKVKLAESMDACLPKMQKNPLMNWNAAFHPILRDKNKLNGKTTVPQSINLNPEACVLVISGPNAGGKSLTLKTCGLLQCMLQSGLLIPVEPTSKACVFSQIYTDIGDNQSIDIELSTYSYRLKRMNFFLSQADGHTLLLLDEFGSGSDPELGSALAEVFFEELVKTNAFVILTTHYSSIKRKVTECPSAINGSMRFDESNWLPLFELQIGQPGSSFTFEVAKSNGIPSSWIDRAKNLLSQETLRFNQILVDLQQEKNKLQLKMEETLLLKNNLEEQLSNSSGAEENFAYKTKQLRMQIEEQAKLIQLGSKLQKWMDVFNANAKRKDIHATLFEEFKTYLLKERAKRSQSPKKAPQITSKSSNKATNPKAQTWTWVQGDKVRISGIRDSGIVQSVKGDTATVSVRALILKIPLFKLSPFLE
jgi:DNA mismatch repair protein MutS2